MYSKELAIAGAAIVVLTFAYVGAALAQPAAAWSLCSNDGISSQQRINGCTLVIQSGTESQTRLATAYHNRGLALLDRGDNDLALADFDAAVKLNPNETGYFYNRANSLLARARTIAQLRISIG